MAVAEFDFEPLDGARAAADEAKPIGVDDEQYDAMVTLLEKYLEDVSPDMVRGRARLEAYSDAQCAVMQMRAWVWPSADATPQEGTNG